MPFLDRFNDEANERAAKAQRQVLDDREKYKPHVISQPGQPLEVNVELADDAGPDEIIAAMQAAAREAGLL